MYGWVILGDTATKRVNGQEVIITAGKSGDIGVAIRAWEDAERHRMLYELGNLGRLVDAAMTRLQLHHRASGSRGKRAPETGDIR
ncbi:hypothetical protein OHA77_20835 [Streptosporangium sp. NBC_01639]|uniref:hypothetical protein n=1 Tax=Streptosporangium sp. NBC_01639 TaxID=2975948 RepID=UPI003868859B|nr:hypothetical protein OHA77_20835 [Streptosporangium sp. NBC_01639]